MGASDRDTRHEAGRPTPQQQCLRQPALTAVLLPRALVANFPVRYFPAAPAITATAAAAAASVTATAVPSPAWRYWALQEVEPWMHQGGQPPRRLPLQCLSNNLQHTTAVWVELCRAGSATACNCVGQLMGNVGWDRGSVGAWVPCCRPCCSSARTHAMSTDCAPAAPFAHQHGVYRAACCNETGRDETRGDLCTMWMDVCVLVLPHCPPPARLPACLQGPGPAGCCGARRGEPSLHRASRGAAVQVCPLGREGGRGASVCCAMSPTRYMFGRIWAELGGHVIVRVRWERGPWLGP